MNLKVLVSNSKQFITHKESWNLSSNTWSHMPKVKQFLNLPSLSVYSLIPLTRTKLNWHWKWSRAQSRMSMWLKYSGEKVVTFTSFKPHTKFGMMFLLSLMLFKPQNEMGNFPQCTQFNNKYSQPWLQSKTLLK